MTTDDERLTAFSFRRQGLDGSAPDALEAVARVVGVYSAMPGGPLSIRVRAGGITADDVRSLETRRDVVRMRAMRTSAFVVPVTTAGLVSAATAVPEARFRWLLRESGVEDGELPAIRATVLRAAGVPGTPRELRERLARDGSSPAWTQGPAFGRVLSLLTAYGDLAAVGGASLSSNALAYVDRRTWFEGASDAAVDPTEARAWLAGEYLRAFGPARVADLAWWAGWGRRTAEHALAANDTVEVGDGLRVLASDVAHLDAATPLDDAISLLPKWDAWTMGYPLDGRARFVDMAVHDRVFDGDGNALAMVLRAGRAIGAWAHRARGTTMEADLDLFQPVAATERETIDAELGAIATFLGYRGVTVRLVPTVVPVRRRVRRPLPTSVAG